MAICYIVRAAPGPYLYYALCRQRIPREQGTYAPERVTCLKCRSLIVHPPAKGPATS